MAKTCEGVLSDLRAVSDFVRAQAALGVDTSALGQAQVSAMTTRLRVLQGISVQQATQLTEAVNEGPWTPAQKSELGEAVGGLVSAGAAAKPRREMQHAPHFEQYLSAAEWGALRSRAMCAAKVQQLAARAWSIGLTCPSEPTVVRMAAIMLACSDPPLDGSTVYAELKKAVKSMQVGRSHPFPHLVVYPPAPTALPAEMFAFAYPDIPPLEVNMPELAGIAASIRMRGKGSHAAGDGQGAMVQVLTHALQVLTQASSYPVGVMETPPRSRPGPYPLASIARGVSTETMMSTGSSPDQPQPPPHPRDLPQRPQLALPWPVQQPGAAAPSPTEGAAPSPTELADPSPTERSGLDLAASMAAFRPKPPARTGEEDIVEMEKNLLHLGKTKRPVCKKPARAEPAASTGETTRPAGAEQVCKKPARAESAPSGETGCKSEQPARAEPAGCHSHSSSNLERVPKFRKVPKLGCTKCRYAKNGCAECRGKVAKYAQYYG